MEDVTANAAWWQYGAIGVMLVVFGLVIRYLFKRYERREVLIGRERVAMAAEREAWNTQKETLRAEYEKSLRTQIETFLAEARAERVTNREHEDLARAEFAEIIERISAEASRSSTALVEMLQKFYDRFVGPRSRGQY
jgi:hypothetical protein